MRTEIKEREGKEKKQNGWKEERERERHGSSWRGVHV